VLFPDTVDIQDLTDAKAKEGVMWHVAQDAGCLNRIARIFAPHYRQANIGYKFKKEDGEKALDLAYNDVAKAFKVFLAAGGTRPFFIASHSQGSMHALRLLQEVMEGDEVARRRMVCAYIPGAPFPKDVFQRVLHKVKPSQGAMDVGGVCSWHTRSEGQKGYENAGKDKHVYYADTQAWERTGLRPQFCINPLNWESNAGPKGAGQWMCASSSDYSNDYMLDNRQAQGTPAIGHMGAAVFVANQTHKQVMESKLELEASELKVTGISPLQIFSDLEVTIAEDGWLQVSKLHHQPYSHGENDFMQYHDFDWALFRGNIRQNALERLETWMMSRRPLKFAEFEEPDRLLWEVWAGSRLESGSLWQGTLYADGGGAKRT